MEGRWFLCLVTGMRNAGKATFAVSCCGVLALAMLLAAGSFAPAAYAAIDRSILKSQEGSSALLRGRYDLAIAAFDEALKDTSLSPTRQAPILCDRGVAKWKLKQYDAAIADFSKAVSLNADYAPAYNNRGNVYMDLNRTEEAYKDFDKAIALSPNFGPAYSNRANANQGLRRLDAAEKDFRKAMELMPSSSVPLNGRGKIASVLGRQYTGLRYLNRAIALNGQYASAFQNRAAVYASLNRNDEATQDLDKVIGIVPDSADLYIARGKAVALGKRPQQALKDFTKALELSPDNLQALIGRGAQLIDYRRLDLALEDFNKALSTDPKATQAYYWRAVVRHNMNDIDGAEADLAKAVEIDPNYAEAYRYRASMRDKSGRRDEAIADYRRALECDPFLHEAREAYRALSGDNPDSVVRPIAAAVDGWEVIHPGNGQFTALNDHYPKLSVLLEVPEDGPPEIVEWTQLKDSLAGVGLLRYRTPAKGGGVYDYVAILDISRGQVLGVEPYIAGGAKSKWAWTPTSVTVTDMDGLSSYYELRKPEPVRRDYDPFGGWGRPSGGGGRGFGWFFR